MARDEQIERKKLATRAMSDKAKKALARKIIRLYGTTGKSWLNLCKDNGISISTLWGWVDKFNLGREKRAAAELAKIQIVKYDPKEEYPVKEAEDGQLIPMQDTDEYRRVAFAISRVCLRYGLGEGENLEQLYKEEGISRKVFYRYVQNFAELEEVYKESKENRQKLITIHFQEAKIAIAEGIISSLMQQVRPVQVEKKTRTVERGGVVGYDEETDEEVTIGKVIEKVQTHTQLPTAQILTLAAKAIGWIKTEDLVVVDATDLIGDFSNVEILNQRQSTEDDIQARIAARKARRDRHNTIPTDQKPVVDVEVEDVE